MFADPFALLAPASVERLVLLINHVLRAEPEATRRMRLHIDKGIRLDLDGWPQWLPALPVLDFRVTPAGLLEWCGAAAGPDASADPARSDDQRATSSSLDQGDPGSRLPDLRVRMALADAARLASALAFGPGLGGGRGAELGASTEPAPSQAPTLVIEGDALLAADVDWLVKNLRWDIAADLEGLFGPVAAHELARIGTGLAQGLKAALHAAGELAARFRTR